MKFLLIVLLIGVVFFQSNAQTNPVIVELFTSQGCSSCPAADKNLSDILANAHENGMLVYGLSFHVDYWNYIGWKDPYSRKEFTARQQKYAEVMNLQSIYTPQMVVNGKKEFVGSDRRLASVAVQQASVQKPHYQIGILNKVIKDDQLSFQYTLDKTPEGEKIHVAIVEKEVENYVPRGENSGQKLLHNNVVRVFSSFPARKQSDIEVVLPVVNSNRTSVIIYIQRNNGQIVASTMIKL